MSANKKKPTRRRSPASVDDATERLAAIVEAAEKAASTVIDNAEQKAQKKLEEAAGRADRVVAERLRALADELDPPAAADQPTAPRLRPVESADAEEQTPRRAGSSGARLLATQMAVSGASREEIESRLQSDFEINDTSEILDAILGPEE
jgi:hypothetical protein